MGEGAGAVEADADLFEGPVGRFAGTGIDFRVAFDELLKTAPDRRRKVLKSWSMSTGVVVEARPRVASLSNAGLLFGPGLIET